MPASRWRFFRCCAGIVSLIALASLRNIVVIAALLLYPATLSSTGSANIVICSSCCQHYAGIIDGVALALSSSLRWHLHALL
jgi:hypothetical protein